MRRLRKSYAVIFDPWIEPSAFNNLASASTMNTDNDAKFQNFETYKNKAKFHLYRHINHDQAILAMSRSAVFASRVSRLSHLHGPSLHILKSILHTNNECSVALNKLCKELPAMFAKHNTMSHIDPRIFATEAGNARANSAAITALLTFDKKDPFPLFPPFMYCDQQKENKDLLLNPLGPAESPILHYWYIIFIYLTGPSFHTFC